MTSFPVRKPGERNNTMGSLPRLKDKDRLRYRKGSTNESFNCACCLNFVKSEEHNKGAPPAVYGRCKLLGIKESIRYRVRKDHTCDAHVFDESKCWWMTRKWLSQDAAACVRDCMEAKP